jgi:type II secretory pathway pseudopilin PulG
MVVFDTCHHWKKARGFTFIETLVVISITLTLLGLASMSMLGSQRTANLTEALDIFIADLRSQQVKAMTGETISGVQTAGYGIYIESNRYVLFSGDTYNAADTTNASVPFKSPVYASSIPFPNQTIVFLAKSGEVSNFVQGSNTISISEQHSSKTKTISINQYGVITAIQ